MTELQENRLRRRHHEYKRVLKEVMNEDTGMWQTFNGQSGTYICVDGVLRLELKGTRAHKPEEITTGLSIAEIEAELPIMEEALQKIRAIEYNEHDPKPESVAVAKELKEMLK